MKLQSNFKKLQKPIIKALIFNILWCFAHFAMAQTTICFNIESEAEEEISTGVAI